MLASDQVSTPSEPGRTAPSKHTQRDNFGAKTGPHRGAAMEVTPTAAVDPCEACKAAKRQSMRGPKSGYLILKSISYYTIERKIIEACRLACAE